jgi:hypothetical protein
MMVTPGRTGFPESSIAEHFGERRRTVMIFGAGHVGRALVLALAPLPYRRDLGRSEARGLSRCIAIQCEES